jgi:hypothetical protein
MVFGALAGLKLTNVVFVIGFVAGLLACGQTAARTIRETASAVGGVLIGMLATAGPLAVALWREFRNPAFPYFNQIFKSPLFPSADARDLRFVPKSFLGGLSYPFQWLVGLSPSNELPFQDTRFAVIVALLFAAAVVACLTAFGKGYLNCSALELREDRIVAPRVARFMVPFFLCSFVIWLFVFGIQRYIVPLELLAGVMLLILVDLVVLARVAKLAVLIALSLGGMLVIKIPNWGRVPWQQDWYGMRIPAAFTAEGSLYLILSEPVGYAFPYLSRASRFIAVRGKEGYSDKPALFEKVRDIIRDHRGRRYMIIGKGEYVSGRLSYGEWMSQWGLKITRDSCTSVTSRPRDLVMCMLEPLKLSSEPDDVAHVGFGEEIGPAGYRVAPPIAFGDAFSVEALLTAGSAQGPYATILSNHPGSKNFHGMSIETGPNGGNRFGVGVGSGSDWMSCGALTLQPGERSYVAVVVEHQECSVYLNGFKVSRTELRSPPPDTDYPMTVGNWGSPDRPFAGEIDEIRLARRPPSGREVFATAKRAGVIHRSPGPVSRLALPKTSDLLHLGFSGQASGWQVPGVNGIAAAALIELVVKPEKEQCPAATLIGNQPGTKAFQGFSVQKSSDGAEKYEVIWGTGKAWVSVGQFLLPAGRRSYVAISSAGRSAKIYVNGKLVSVKTLDSDFVESDEPVVVGNSPGGDRAFSGVLEEIRVSNQAFSDSYAIDTTQRLKITP